jgi:hypothetical protein
MSPEKRKSVPIGGLIEGVTSGRAGQLKLDRARRESGRF